MRLLALAMACFRLLACVLILGALVAGDEAWATQDLSGDDLPNATPQLTCSPASLHFPKIIVGSSQSEMVTMKNAGPSKVTISKMTTVASFLVTHLHLPLTLAAGQRTEFEVTFTPSVVGIAQGQIVFTSNASNSTLDLPVSGQGVLNWALVANPPALHFGKVQTGTTSTLPVALTNTGSSTITVSQDALKGAHYSFSGLTLPLVLKGGQSFTFHISFAPKLAKLYQGSMLVSNVNDPALGIALTGSGTSAGELSINPAKLNFGNVAVGSKASLGGTLSAIGSNVTISSATDSNAVYALISPSLPVTIGDGKSIAFTVTFSPQQIGPQTGTLTFKSNALDSPLAESLAGVGAQGYSVGLSWNASSSLVIGYNIYRATNPQDGFQQVNSELDPTTSYVDNTVAAGTTYYYTTTAVNSSGVQSKFSNKVKVVIP